METKEQILDQIQTIHELRREQLLTEEEFQTKYNALDEKLKVIAQRETKEKELLEEQELDNEVTLQSKPLVDKLEALLKTGILTNEEFISKRDKVFNDQKLRVIERIATSKKQDYTFLVVSLIAFSFILLAVVFLSLNANQINEVPEKAELPIAVTTQNKASESYIFQYSAMQTLGLNGIETIYMQLDTVSGSIEFTKNEVNFYSSKGTEKFIIDEHLDAPAGDMYGSHLFYAHNNKNEKYNITVTRRSGADVVIFHQPEMEIMMVFYISEGFTLELEIYQDSILNKNTVENTNPSEYRESFSFDYSKAKIQVLKKYQAISSRDTNMVGKIVFEKDRILIGQISEPTVLYIDEYARTNTGSYAFVAHDKDLHNFQISVLKDDDELVGVRSVENDVVFWFYIDKGFTLDLNIYSE